jgi:hypothetical protein
VVELWQLLELVLRTLPGTYLVIDGLDECESCEDAASNLKRLSLQADLLKVLVLGRPSDASLWRVFRSSRTLSITAENNFTDISSYISDRIEQVYNLSLDPEFSVTEEDTTELLAKASNGMFLWARLMMELLLSPALYAHERSDILRGVGIPEGLEELYSRILRLLSAKRKPERELAAKIFMWIACAKDNLNVDELEVALVQEGPVARRSVVGRIRNFSEVALVVCGGLVEISAKCKKVSTRYRRGLQISDFLFYSVHFPVHTFISARVYTSTVFARRFFRS